MVEEYVGTLTPVRQATPYERFMEEQGVPVHRGMVGVYDCRELATAPWKRMGGRGAFIELTGSSGLKGMYVLEIPGAGAVAAEKHLYEEIFYVLEGRGTTEIWTDDNPRKQTFEWQPGSMFSAPLNTWHRLINAASSPALVLGVTNAPPIMAVYDNEEFLFNSPFRFADRYDGSDDYFKEQELGKDPSSGRARNYGNIIPDVVNVEIPLDQQRGSGHRTFFWNLSHNTSRGFIAEYPSGRYTTCHAHESGAVLLCVKGKGYSITWPRESGTQPWVSGKGDTVKRQDYLPGGLVSAAPGDATWFHGHFGVSKEPMRVIAFLGGPIGRTAGSPGEETRKVNLDVKKGGGTIQYRDEDPHIREMFKEALAKEGAQFTMPEEAYR